MWRNFLDGYPEAEQAGIMATVKMATVWTLLTAASVADALGKVTLGQVVTSLAGIFTFLQIWKLLFPNSWLFRLSQKKRKPKDSESTI